MKILIDNGHGETSPNGSPDGRLKEYSYARDIAQRVSRLLSLRHMDAILITPEEYDVKLSDRVKRVNAWCRKLGAKNVMVVSIHVDAAASDGKWHDARGCSVYVSSTNASQRSKDLAKAFTNRIVQMGLKGNRCIPPEGFWKRNLAICRDTLCAAVLTENGFQDNKADVDFLLTEDGRDAIARLHVEAICDYAKQCQ